MPNTEQTGPRLPFTGGMQPSDYKPAQRVQFHPATDQWMKGIRYGTVVSILSKYVLVRGDRDDRLHRMHPDNLIHID